VVEIFENKVPSSSLKAEYLFVRHVAPFGNHNASKVTGVENGGHISHFLTPPVKFKRG